MLKCISRHYLRIITTNILSISDVQTAFYQLTMKPCLKCSQYHHPSRGQHRCLTYEKFTYLLKDEFMKRNKQEDQKSKMMELSYVRPSVEIATTAQKKKQYLTDEEQNRTIKNKKHQQELSVIEKQIDKKIEQVIDKCKGCRKRHKDCKHLTSTSCDEQFSPQRKFVEQDEEFEVREQTQWEKLIIPPTEQSFKKPFNSRLLKSQKKEQSKIIYDSLFDNRLCGVPLCEEGEIIGEIDYLQSILAQSYKQA